jgi:hypothetical protein
MSCHNLNISGIIHESKFMAVANKFQLGFNIDIMIWGEECQNIQPDPGILF